MISTCRLRPSFLFRMPSYRSTTISASSSTKLIVIVFPLRCRALISVTSRHTSASPHWKCMLHYGVNFWNLSSFILESTLTSISTRGLWVMLRASCRAKIRYVAPQHLIKGLGLAFLIKITKSYLGRCFRRNLARF